MKLFKADSGLCGVTVAAVAFEGGDCGTTLVESSTSFFTVVVVMVDLCGYDWIELCSIYCAFSFSLSLFIVSIQSNI
jgi:hypothetical protein